MKSSFLFGYYILKLILYYLIFSNKFNEFNNKINQGEKLYNLLTYKKI